MLIRKMTIDDYDEVYSIWISCKGMGLNSLDDSKDGINKFLNRNPDTCFTATEENKIVGCILAGNDGRRGYVYHTAVSPDYRQKGIGTKLTEKVIEALKEIGISKAALLVFANNENGNQFWNKIGFTERNDLIYRNKTIKESDRIDT
ncbi:MAG: GNAT family N-acetyltransferase [Acetobacter sp.]|nr:GNAT family N-acetyltransferase [Bacteroides sp.]MCM1341450.1 GNAT family N-acetyltransferase [Acetobacter sp.]MCM1433402.1 GNAT family N-acetyltransferase [Clostridiales bacterium]